MDQVYVYFDNRKFALSAGAECVIGRDPSCDIVLEDARVSRRHASLKHAEGCVLLADLGSLNGTWYEGKRVASVALRSNSSFRIASCNLSIRTELENIERKRLESGDTMLFEKQFAGIMEQVHDPGLRRDVDVLRTLFNRKKEKLSELAFYDALTGIYNRRLFDVKIAEEVSRAIRYRRALSLLMIDIDHFKKVNDEHGHQAGDSVLASVARTLKESLRGTDIVCRYGGEEIAVILPETGAGNACRIAENCRKRIAVKTKEAIENGVTVSIGVSELAGVEAPEPFIKNADAALYRAKKAGRNQVVLFEDGMIE